MISEKIKSLRKKANLSQEELANKLGVSRQAITKWETGAGIPDIDNLVLLSRLFKVSLDELVGYNSIVSTSEYLFKSNFEYDIDILKDYDIDFGGSRKIYLLNHDSEKLKISICSNTIDNLEELFKIKIDDVKRKIDILIKRNKALSETQAKKDIVIYVYVPRSLSSHIELNGNAVALEVSDVTIKHIEYGGHLESALLKGIDTHFEMDVNGDISVICNSCRGKLDINQISSTSILKLENCENISLLNKGRGTRIIAKEKYLNIITDPSLIIELNGMKSELTVEVI